ncbi:iojap-like ribosome-associated protein [Idiomarina sp. A28L]|uniref:ribosome silencing factor n=1 Tax=Idiomarina sp. A28L TaxID=1036674 RepID=UPI00021386C0|nr:ribosome silencing factor [Idiomarina sp. A28L]EGN76388.1 iojap-like ribosome-associated protein [Idiomarina sp. A28L]
MQTEQLRDFILSKIEDLKGRDIQVLDIRDKTDVTDFLVICSGNSKTHVRSIAKHVALEAKHVGEIALGMEGEDDGEWVLVDFGPVVAHVMQDSTRDFYQLEKLWG